MATYNRMSALSGARVAISQYNYRQNGSFLSKNFSAINRIRPDFRRLRDEMKRLSSFYDWPSTANANPVALAREGFYYTGTADRVQCVYCRGCLRDWELTDDPRSEHKRHFPKCPSFRGLQVHDTHLPSEHRPNTVDRGENGSPSILGTPKPNQVLFVTETYGIKPREIRTQTGAFSFGDFHKVLAVIKNKLPIEVEDNSDDESPPEPVVRPPASVGDAAMRLNAVASATSANDNSVPAADSTPSESYRKKKRKKKRK